MLTNEVQEIHQAGATTCIDNWNKFSADGR